MVLTLEEPSGHYTVYMMVLRKLAFIYISEKVKSNLWDHRGSGREIGPCFLRNAGHMLETYSYTYSIL